MPDSLLIGNDAGPTLPVFILHTVGSTVIWLDPEAGIFAQELYALDPGIVPAPLVAPALVELVADPGPAKATRASIKVAPIAPLAGVRLQFFTSIAPHPAGAFGTDKLTT